MYVSLWGVGWGGEGGPSEGGGGGIVLMTLTYAVDFAAYGSAARFAGRWSRKPKRLDPESSL